MVTKWRSWRSLGMDTESPRCTPLLRAHFHARPGPGRLPRSRMSARGASAECPNAAAAVTLLLHGLPRCSADGVSSMTSCDLNHAGTNAPGAHASREVSANSSAVVCASGGSPTSGLAPPAILSLYHPHHGIAVRASPDIQRLRPASAG